jgi:hypothetical protein
MHAVFAARRRQVNGVLVVQPSGIQMIEAEGDKWRLEGGGGSGNKLKVQNAVGKVMASILCCSDGTLLVELRVMCAEVKEVTTKFSQITISIIFPSQFLSTAPRSN